VDVVFGEGRSREVAQPDILFIATERRSIITRAEIAGAPDIVVEVLSPGTEERDRNYKRTLYQRYGVEEYWIVDPDAHVLDRYVLTAEGFGAPQRYAESDGFETRCSPAFSSPCPRSSKSDPAAGDSRPPTPLGRCPPKRPPR